MTTRWISLVPERKEEVQFRGSVLRLTSLIWFVRLIFFRLICFQPICGKTISKKRISESRTFVNLEDLRIAHQLLDRVLAVEAGSAEYLNRLGGVLVGHIGRVRFGDRCKVGVPSALIW